MCSIDDCYLVEGGYWIDKVKHKFRRNLIMPDFCSTSTLRSQRNNTGIFKTAYRYNIADQDKAELYGDFYLDFDSTSFELVRKDALKALSYLKIVFNLDIDNSCQIFFSGNKGVHIVVPAEVLGVTPNNNLNDVYKTIAEALFDYIDNKTLDLRIYDKKRMFRIPNSIHEVTGFYKVNISLKELRYESYTNIKQMASAKRDIAEVNRTLNNAAHNIFDSFIEKTKNKIAKFNNIKSNGTLKYTPPCIKEILDNGAQEGQRNNTIAIVASFYKACGKDMEEAVKEMAEWNEIKTSNPVSNYELRRTVQSIYVSEMQFGCSSIKNLGLCSDEYCKFKK